MTDPHLIVAAASTGLVGFGIVSAAMLRGWTGWLELRRLELQGSGSGERQLPAARMEVAALKERVRKLEAIASGAEN